MSCTKFFYNNLVKSATLTPSSENALFPVENIQDDRRTKVFRSTANSDDIYFDFGSAEEIDSFMAVGHIINGIGFSSASLELNNVATWTSGAIETIPITIDYVNNLAYGSVDIPVNARYAKLILTSTTGFVEVSKVFIGASTEIGTNDFSFPLKFQNNNLGSAQKNRYGQKFFDIVISQKSFSAGISTMTNEEVEVIYQLAGFCSIDRPFFMRIDGAQVFSDGNRTAGYYYLKDDPVYTYSPGGFWNADLILEEGT